MRLSTSALAALLLLAPAAAAQEPPAPPVPPKAPEAPAAPAAPAKGEEAPAKPAKHENKVTPEAKAAWEAMGKVLYNPVALGLKELKGKMVMKMEMAGMEDMGGMEGMEGMPEMKMDVSIDFKAPKTVEIAVTTDNPMLQQAVGQIQQQVRSQFLASCGIMEPPAEQEFDASLETKEGAKVLVVKFYEKNEPQGEMRMNLDAAGLFSKGTLTQTDANTGMEMSMDITYKYLKDGEAHRMDRMEIVHPMFPEPMETVMQYHDTGEFKVMTGMRTKGPMGMNFLFGYSELTVNGKKIDLPKEEKKAEPKKETPADGAAPVPAGEGAKEPKDEEPKPKSEEPK
jgi:hypothetical protein